MSPIDVLATPHALAALLRIGVNAFHGALPLPNWQSSDQVREWLGKLSPTVRHLASRTVTTLDDACAALFAKIVESDGLWEATWEVLTSRLDPAAPDREAERILAEACAEADQNTGSTDPTVVLALIEAVVDLVKAISPEAPTVAPVMGAPVAPETDDEAGSDYV